MPAPNLLNPTTMTVLPIDKGNTSYDIDAREPIRSAVYATEIAIACQPSYRNTRRAKMAMQGLSEEIIGYVVVRARDLLAKGWTPTIGDKITKIGARSVEWYLDQPVDLGHWGDQQGRSLLKLYFSDRRPETAAPRYT